MKGKKRSPYDKGLGSTVTAGGSTHIPPEAFMPPPPAPNLTQMAGQGMGNIKSPATPQVTLFTREGKTFTFKHITDLVANEFCVSFDYIAMSDSNIKHATFFVASLAGWSKTY